MSGDGAVNGVVPGDGYVQRNFGLTREQDEWLRERAYRRDLSGMSSKTEIVRSALDEFITRHPT